MDNNELTLLRAYYAAMENGLDYGFKAEQELLSSRDDDDIKLWVELNVTREALRALYTEHPELKG